jgi:predicted metal-dependent hydrolase
MVSSRRPTAPAVTPRVETVERAELPGGRLIYTLRRSPRSRGLRVTIHPERGVVVSVPLATRRGWANPVPHAEAFLRAREAWIRGHLDDQTARRAQIDQRPALGAGRAIPFHGIAHIVRIHPAPGQRRSRVVAIVGPAGHELRVECAPADRRSVEQVLDAWLREQAHAAIDQAIQRHAGPMQVAPAAVTLRDPRSRWGSCSREGRLSFSWRLVLAPPAALETVVVHELCHLRVFGHGPRFRALLASRVPDHVTWRRWLREHAHELHAALDPSGAQDAA